MAQRDTEDTEQKIKKIEHLNIQQTPFRTCEPFSSLPFFSLTSRPSRLRGSLKSSFPAGRGQNLLPRNLRQNLIFIDAVLIFCGKIQQRIEQGI